MSVLLQLFFLVAVSVTEAKVTILEVKFSQKPQT